MFWGRKKKESPKFVLIALINSPFITRKECVRIAIIVEAEVKNLGIARM